MGHILYFVPNDVVFNHSGQTCTIQVTPLEQPCLPDNKCRRPPQTSSWSRRQQVPSKSCLETQRRTNCQSYWQNSGTAERFPWNCSRRWESSFRWATFVLHSEYRIHLITHRRHPAYYQLLSLFSLILRKSPDL